MELPYNIVEKEKAANNLVENGISYLSLASMAEILVLVLSFSLRHGLSDVAIDDLLKIICLLKPDFPYSSTYFYKKQFTISVLTIQQFILEKVQVHWYFLECQ